MTRGKFFIGLLFMLTLVAAVDAAVSDAPNVFNAPSLLAWGSGKAAEGALCTNL